MSISAFASILASCRGSVEDYQAVTKALLAALGSSELEAWKNADKHSFYRQLILQEDCLASKSVLGHEAASQISGGNLGIARSLAKELTPVLKELLSQPSEVHPGYKNAVVLLLVLRTFLDGVVPNSQIKQLHLDWFEHFGRGDLELPYSTMFCRDFYGINEHEILRAYPPKCSAVLENPAIRTWHVLFFEWLSGQDYFEDSDNSDLDAFLDRCLSDHREDQRPYARSLVLRHLRPGGRLDEARLVSLGLGNIALSATRLAESRAKLQKPREPLPIGARCLQKRPWQAIQAARAFAAAWMPVLARRQRNLRIAVCVSGQLRGYQQALESWRRTIFRSVDPTFFIHSWKSIGRAGAQPFRQVLPFEGTAFVEAYRKEVGLMGIEEAYARYPVLFEHLKSGAEADTASLVETYGTENVVLQSEDEPSVAHFSNQQKMHYKIHAADRMARAVGEFDLFVRIRPDLEIRTMAFDWRDLYVAANSRSVLYAEKPVGLHYGNLMVGDQFAVAESDTMAIYANTWESFPEIALTDTGGWPSELKGHVSLALTCWSNGIAMEKAPLRFGRLLDAAPMALKEIQSALETDIASRTLDRSDMALLTAVGVDIDASAKS